MVGDKVIMVN